MPTKQVRYLYLGFAVLMGFLWEFMVWEKMGNYFTLFVAIYTLIFFSLAFANRQLANKWPMILLLPIGMVCFDIYRLNNEFLMTMGPFFVLLLLVLMSVLLTVQKLNLKAFALSGIPLFRHISAFSRQFAYIFADMFPPLRKYTNDSRLQKVLLGILASVPILFIFFILFVNADGVFLEWVERLLSFEVNPDVIATVFRITFISLALGAFFYALISDGNKMQADGFPAPKIDNIVASTVLCLVNVLFFSFVFFQVKYLFGDASYVLESGTTYATYARSGFFELTWVLALAGLLIGTVYWSMSERKNSRFVNVLQILLALQVAVIAASALKRMNLYQDVYGYTTLRLHVEWFIYFALTILAFGICALLVRLRFRHFFHSALILAITASTIVFSINIDYLIAKANIDRALESKASGQETEVDLYYLSTLSVDSLPALKQYSNEELESIGLTEL